MTKESFLRGAVILALASTVSRLIGLVYMVVLPRLIHDVGMGLYQLVKPIHYFAAVVAIGGMPVAISKLIAEKVALGSPREVMRVFRLGMLIMILTGGLVAVALVIGAPWFAKVFAKDPGVTRMLAILGPACLFLSLSAGFRGFFQGLQSMTPTAISQVIDQIVRVGATIGLSIWLRPRGIEMAVTGVAWGFIVGELTGWLILLGYYFTQRDALIEEIRVARMVKPEPSGQIVARLLSLAAPAVVATILWPIMQLADSFLIPLRMQAAGFSPDTIREGLGHLGMALTLAQFPNIITVALATSLVPAISEAWTLRNSKLVRYRAEEALRIALIFGIPACAALYVLAEPLSVLLFRYAQVGIPLRILSVGTVTLGVIQASTGVLQGLGLMSIPVRNLGIGVVIKFTLNYVLVANTQLGILGAAWSTTLGWLLIAVLNLISVYRKVGHVINWKTSLIFPSLATGLASLIMYLLYDALNLYLSNGIATLGALIFSLVLYFLLLMIWGSLTERDIQLVPAIGSPLGRWLQEWGFLRK
ncbi:MAG: polysaccharide biosynthesis protein [Firmicutes bacterium]|nr:polysaccharide biosynthesis protein [Bacillota bacterium]